MNERIKELRKNLNLSQEDFAKKLGLKSRGKIANIEFGKIDVDNDFASLICRTFNVNEKWLHCGEGPMFLPEIDEEAAYVGQLLSDEDNPLYDTIKAIMKTYKEMGPKEQEILKAFAKAFRNNLMKKESQD